MTPFTIFFRLVIIWLNNGKYAPGLQLSLPIKRKTPQFQPCCLLFGRIWLYSRVFTHFSWQYVVLALWLLKPFLHSYGSLLISSHLKQGHVWQWISPS